MYLVFFFSSRRRHTRCSRDWSSDVCSSDLLTFWNEIHIIAHGNELIQNVNGHPMSMLVDDDFANRRTSGLIGIQLHAGEPMRRSEERRVGKECRSRWSPYH